MRLADGEGEAVSAIGPGDWVECVDAGSNPGKRGPPLEVGRVYRVQAVVSQGHPCLHDGCGHNLLEVAGVNHELPCCPNRFRPVYRPKADLIASLKAPPVRVGEFA